MKRRPSTAPHSPWWFTGFIVLLALAPLPFGSNRPWSSDLLGLLSGLLLLAMGWHYRLKGFDLGRKIPNRRLLFAASGMAAALLWSFIQTLPIVPTSWQHPLWQATQNLPDYHAGSISLDPSGWTECAIRIISYVACFLLALVGGREEKRAKLLLHALSLIALTYALYGLIAQIIIPNHLLWFDKWAYRGFVTSSFVNKNSFATYAGLGLLCSLTQCWQALKNYRLKDRELAERSWLAAWLKQLSWRDFLPLLPPLIILTALVLAGSRAGLASTLMGLLVFAMTITINRRWSWRIWLPLCLFGLLFLAGIIGVGGDMLATRSGSEHLDSEAAVRFTAYRLTLEAISANPWMGYGLGTFDNAFRLFRDASLQFWFQHAHNDYLELAFELGLPASLAMLSAVLLMVSCSVQGVWQRRRMGIFPALSLAAAALVGTHALFDFSLQIPVIAATFAALLGLGVAQSWSSREQSEN